MPRTFTRPDGSAATLPTAEESYEDGYETGKRWDSAWNAGGPWVCNYRYGNDMEQWWIDYCAASSENKKEWKRGFSDGLIKSRLSTT